MVECEGYEVFDAMDDYLTEECNMHDYVIDESPSDDTYRILILDPAASHVMLLRLIAEI